MAVNYKSAVNRTKFSQNCCLKPSHYCPDPSEAPNEETRLTSDTERAAIVGRGPRIISLPVRSSVVPQLDGRFAVIVIWTQGFVLWAQDGLTAGGHMQGAVAPKEKVCIR